MPNLTQTVRWLATAAIIAAIALAGRAMADLYERHKLIALAAKDIRAASHQLATKAARQDCDAATDDLDTLLTAITTVESLARSEMWRESEALLVRGALMLAAPLPDLSIGPAQIRVSTAKAAWTEAQGQAPRGLAETRRIALDLLSDCKAREWGRLVLEMYAAKTQTPITPLDRASIHRLTAAFNGQETIPDAEAAVANYLYRELVYQVYQELKFRRAGGRWPTAQTKQGDAAETETHRSKAKE